MGRYKMNYTKGEWKVEIVDATLPKYHKVYARIMPSVAYVGWKDMGVYDDPGVGKRQLQTLSDEALANAHLIAAAPDMYEALRTIRDWLQDLIEKVGADCEEADMLNEISPAIVKAEGKRQ